MPMSFTPISHEQRWTGSTWSVDDEDTLAELIARIALGQAQTVQSILHELGNKPVSPTAGFEGAKATLTAATEDEIFHRDGWVFQVMAWIAAHQQDDTALIHAPHIRLADKGTDGLIIEFQDRGIARVVICEEKATEHPRDRVRDSVWPEFKTFESGRRDNELIAAVSDMLSKNGVGDADATVASIFWNKQRAYRISTIVGATHATEAGRKRLFKDYEKTALGDLTRRRAETLHLADIRPWLAELSNKTIGWIEDAEAVHDLEAKDV